MSTFGERRKEGRGEEVNKPSAFLEKNKETPDRHLHFSIVRIDHGDRQACREIISKTLIFTIDIHKFEFELHFKIRLFQAIMEDYSGIHSA